MLRKQKKQNMINVLKSTSIPNFRIMRRMPRKLILINYSRLLFTQTFPHLNIPAETKNWGWPYEMGWEQPHPPKMYQTVTVKQSLVSHLLIFVTWRTRRSRRQPIRRSTAAGVWPRVHITILGSITRMSTVTIGSRSWWTTSTNRAIGSCIKGRSPVITRSAAASWATLCKTNK